MYLGADAQGQGSNLLLIERYSGQGIVKMYKVKAVPIFGRLQTRIDLSKEDDDRDLLWVYRKKADEAQRVSSIGCRYI